MWALVTGGAKRLGASISLSLAEAGYSIAVQYRHSKKEALETVEACRKKGVEAAAVQCDFDSCESVERFGHDYLEQFPDTHLLINNVGNYSTQSVGEIGIADWISLFQTNLHAPFILSKVIGEALIKNRGQMINIGSSGIKKRAAHIYAGAYQLTKESLWAMTLSLAREWAPKQVRVNMVSPGELDNSVDHLPIPMGRPGHIEEICRAVRFLIDPKNSYITGQNIEVAGGLGL
jgi:NAD(P)-dependent dehydrogenase (short-subunit alcohol dehydrogenase family)